MAELTGALSMPTTTNFSSSLDLYSPTVATMEMTSSLSVCPDGHGSLRMHTKLSSNHLNQCIDKS